MSFEMKYDKDGFPIVNPQLLPQAQPIIDNNLTAARQIEQPQQIPVVDNLEMTEQESTVDNMETVEPATPVIPVVKETKDDRELNLRILREKNERLEWEKNEAIRRLQEIEASKNPTAARQMDEPDDLGLGETDFAEGKHLSKVSRKIKELEKKVQQYEQKTASQVTEARIKSQFPDFDNVVTNENISRLQQQYPEIANTLNSSTDLYSTAVSAYTMIKKLGIVPEPVYNSLEKEKALKNLSKPRPLASLSPQQGDSPLSNANAFANGLTEDLKKQLQKEMFAARNQI